MTYHYADNTYRFVSLKECGMHSTSFLRFIAVEKLVVSWTTLFLTASLLYAGLWRGLKMVMGAGLRSGSQGVERE